MSYENINKPEGNSYPETFTQFVANNIDHNLATLDGSSSFHDMEIIAVSTSMFGYESIISNKKILREMYVKSKALVLNKGIPIEIYMNPTEPALSSLIMQPYQNIKHETSFSTSGFDII